MVPFIIYNQPCFHQVSSQNWRPLYNMCLCLLVGPVVFTTAPAEQGLTGRSQSILLALVMLWLRSPSLGTAVASAVFSHPNPICSSLHPLILFIDHEASHSLMNKFQTVHPRASVLQAFLPPYFIPSLLLPQSSQICPPPEHPMHTAPPLLSSPAPLLAQLVGNTRLSSNDLLSSSAQHPPFSVPRHSIGLAVLRPGNC